MMRKVLITRPSDQAHRFAKMITALGGLPVIAPLTQIEKLPVSFENIPSAEAQVITSLHGLPENIPESWKQVPLFIVGEVAAENARIRGFRKIESIALTSREMVPLLQSSPYKDFIYWRGEEVSQDLSEILPSKKITEIPTYRANLVKEFLPEIVMQFSEISLITLFSARSAEALCNAMVKDKLDVFAPSINLLCLSEAVLESARHLNWKETFVARQPTAQAMIDRTQIILQGEKNG